MDKLKECACRFERLLDTQYRIVIGRKGKSLHLTITFDKKDFHHLAGLKKLRDDTFLHTADRGKVYDEIMRESVTYGQISRSAHFARENVGERISALLQIEEFLDSNEIVFKYEPQKAPFSKIEAKFLLSNTLSGQEIFLFLDERDKPEDVFFCRSIFPRSGYDFKRNQISYTLLFKEKINLVDGTSEIQFRHPGYQGEYCAPGITAESHT